MLLIRQTQAWPGLREQGEDGQGASLGCPAAEPAHGAWGQVRAKEAVCLWTGLLEGVLGSWTDHRPGGLGSGTGGRQL